MQMSAERPATTLEDYILLRDFYSAYGERVDDSWLVTPDETSQQAYRRIRGDFLMRNFYADQFFELDESVRADLAAEARWPEELATLSPDDFRPQEPPEQTPS